MKKRKSTMGLLALNICLLCIFAFVTFEKQTEAQTTRAHRYIAVPGEVNGLTPGVVYIMDTSQQELVAITWDHYNKRLTPLGYRPIAADAQAALRNQ
mgnify:CR=1 FL=1